MITDKIAVNPESESMQIGDTATYTITLTDGKAVGAFEAVTAGIALIIGIITITSQITGNASERNFLGVVQIVKSFLEFTQ